MVATHDHSARPATIDRSAIECQKSAATEASHPGDIISERRATSSRNAWASSSESAFSAEYITNILETRARALPEPGPLQLTRRHDLLDIDIAPPDLNAYEVNDHDPE